MSKQYVEGSSLVNIGLCNLWVKGLDLFYFYCKISSLILCQSRSGICRKFRAGVVLPVDLYRSPIGQKRKPVTS